MNNCSSPGVCIVFDNESHRKSGHTAWTFENPTTSAPASISLGKLQSKGHRFFRTTVKKNIKQLCYYVCGAWKSPCDALFRSHKGSWPRNQAAFLGLFVDQVHINFVPAVRRTHPMGKVSVLVTTCRIWVALVSRHSNISDDIGCIHKQIYLSTFKRAKVKLHESAAHSVQHEFPQNSIVIYCHWTVLPLGWVVYSRSWHRIHVRSGLCPYLDILEVTRSRLQINLWESCWLAAPLKAFHWTRASDLSWLFKRLSIGLSLSTWFWNKTCHPQNLRQIVETCPLIADLADLLWFAFETTLYHWCNSISLRCWRGHCFQAPSGSGNSMK